MSLGRNGHNMLFEIEMNDGHVDAVYYCPDLDQFDPPCRKPNPGMALEAKANFPDIDFSIGTHESCSACSQRALNTFSHSVGLSCIIK